jgi:hypothetical protein
VAVAVSVAAAGGSAAARAPAAPRSFFGIVPQTPLTEADAEYMRAGRIGSIRVPVLWPDVQPAPNGGLEWKGLDETVEVAARRRLRVLPFVVGTPRWVARKPTALPVGNARQRRAWSAFLRAVVGRYGPHGEFWREHGTGSEDPVPKMPLREWQVWNEANFFYFAYPVSPHRYARLLKISHRAIKVADPRAHVILSGLFGAPDEGGRRGMPAADFLSALYRVRGIKRYFDDVALHPYAFHVEDLEAMIERVREVILGNHDRRTGLYITEMGWGSQNDPDIVAFEQGVRGQVRELRGAYRYMLRNRRRLRLRGAYWFSWKDIEGACNFCDSVGFFRRGSRLKPKPAWHAFVRLTGGRPRP